MKRYNPKDIEPKWRAWWDEHKTYEAHLDSDKPKYIAMSMFNYPSGAGIHIGHAMNYTISDVLARFKRQQGFESYHPVGWDAFGLPAENYAIKAGVSPQASMATIIPNYHKQYKAMGWSNDWSKEIATHLPEYYRWSQWIFSEMYRAGLAYQDARMQWWCDKCQTVLANEQVLNDKCWRHDATDDPIVTQKEVKQWFFKITEYADELLEAIDDLDWTESVKLAQKNWIGKSEGINITYKVADSDLDIVCYTTTPVNYGLSFIVLAPEHPSVAELTSPEYKEQIDAYVAESVKKSAVERQQEGKKKTGVFTGSYAINHLTGEQVPIWVADFVLMNFGTGAVQGCPAHDERDFEFAAKFNLPIIRVLESEDGKTDRIVDPKTEVVDQVKLNKGIQRKMVNSHQFDGLVFDDAMQKTMDYFEEKGWGVRTINYKLRDWSVSRQRYWGAPIPIINCPDCGPVLVDDSDLPVVLPELEDFQPSGDGRSALARATDWLQVDCPNCGVAAERETDTLDTYICSSWYMLRYMDPKNTEKAFDSKVANKWMPIDFYNGADHATAHMIYARFVTRFFHKKGLLENPEPFKKFLYNGKVTASDGQMFSKSKGNGVDPLEIIDSGYGADALRTYLMFASPLELWTKWDPNGVPGSYRFLNRVFNLVQEFVELPKDEKNDDLSALKITHAAAKKVTDDIEEQRYNTAIAAMMKATNDLYELKAKTTFASSKSWYDALLMLVQLVAPFAPHTAEELWHDLGKADSVNSDHWPEVNSEYLVQETITLAVQVNGKVRAEIVVDPEAAEEEIKAIALTQENVQKHFDGKEPKMVIYVKGRLVSIAI